MLQLPIDLELMLMILVPLPNHLNARAFRQLYEVTRVSLACKVPLSNFSDCLTLRYEDYAQFWAALKHTISKTRNVLLPEKSSLTAWERAGGGFAGVGLTGRLKFLEQSEGPVFELSLQPMRIESSYRLARKYGHDRFCTILFPSLGQDGLPPYLKRDQAFTRDIIIKWLVHTEHCFLGRTWRAFYLKLEPTKKTQKGAKNSSNDGKYRIHLFAEAGVDFLDRSSCGEVDPRKSAHPRVTVKDLVEWFMSSKINTHQNTLKFFSRLGLGS